MPKLKYSQADVVFRDLIKKLRLSKNLTQADLAKRLGVPQSYVSKYETGERRLDFPEMAVICDAIGISLSQFVVLYEHHRSLIPKATSKHLPGALK